MPLFINLLLLFPTLPHRHSGEGRNPGERGRDVGRRTGYARLRQIVKYGVLGCHPRWRGNGLFKSLDSSFRWNDDGEDSGFLWNDGKGIPAFSGMTAGRQIDFSNPLPSGLPPGDPWPGLMRGSCPARSSAGAGGLVDQ